MMATLRVPPVLGNRAGCGAGVAGAQPAKRPANGAEAARVRNCRRLIAILHLLRVRDRRPENSTTNGWAGRELFG
jgi:hypothetical protein